ncbi:retropepsin-like aspartic protease family protein [Sphingomonas sp. GB1N7]|uniref:retropepsin-like aspartic protease family protein n=1 Tax=Parasphingomonas caseinilytica TaxID=3096158 RepID=UPI002FC717C9
MNDLLANLFDGNVPFYVVIAAGVMVLIAARRFRVFGNLLTLALAGVALAILIPVIKERARYDPRLARLGDLFGRDTRAQQAVGGELRVPMAADGHFWVDVRIGDRSQRMLIDSGATITALSERAAAAAGLRTENPSVPVMLQTANGSIRARTATIPELHVGNVVARDVPVVVSPAFGDMSVVGMNFLSRLKSWRVEGDTLILVPHHPQDPTT